MYLIYKDEVAEVQGTSNQLNLESAIYCGRKEGHPDKEIIEEHYGNWHKNWHTMEGVKRIYKSGIIVCPNCGNEESFNEENDPIILFCRCNYGFYFRSILDGVENNDKY